MTTYNINIVGSLTNDNGILSGFYNSNYAIIPPTINLHTTSWRIKLKFTTGYDVSTDQGILTPYTNDHDLVNVWLSASSVNVYLCDTDSSTIDILSLNNISANTTYWLDVSFDGSTYILKYSLDGTNYSIADSVTSSTLIVDNTLQYVLGNGRGINRPFLGSIDLNKCSIIIDNTIRWQGIRSYTSTRIQLRRDTASNWTNVNPVLLEGEVGIETDTGKSKVGDGSTAWNSLGYDLASTALQSHQSLANYVDLSSAQTITGLKSFSGNIKTDTVYNTNNNPILQIYSSNTRVGNSNYGLNLLGNTTRPQYQNRNGTPVDLALYSDIPSSEVFIATYGTTTYSDISTALTAGKFIYAKRTVSGIDSYAPLIYFDSSEAIFGAIGNVSAISRYKVSSSDVWSATPMTPADNTLSNVSSIDSGSAVQTALNGRVDTDLSNISATGKIVIDGQWIYKDEDLTTLATSLNGSTSLPYTLSDIPNDGHEYEALISFWGSTGSTSGNAIEIRVQSDKIQRDIYVCRAVTRAASSASCAGNVIIPLTSSRKVYVTRATGWNGTFEARMLGYRRIGTNT